MLLSRLPQPTREYAAPPPKAASAALPASITKEPPPYGTAERRQYAPRKQEDFGDGGAHGWRRRRSGFACGIFGGRPCKEPGVLCGRGFVHVTRSFAEVYIHRLTPPWGRGAGAFPEVQVVQFPLGMGRPDKAGKGGPGTLAVTVGSDGGINYDAVVKQGRNRDKVVAATHGAMVPKLDRLTDGVRRPAALLLCARLRGASFLPYPSHGGSSQHSCAAC